MSGLEIGICISIYVLALLAFLLRKRKWKLQQDFITYKGKHAFRANDGIPFIIIAFLVISFQVKSFHWIGLLSIVPILFICIILVINYNGIGDKGVLHFSDQYLFEDIEVYYIGNINGRFVLNVKGITSRLRNSKKKSIDMDVAELILDEADVSMISDLFEAHVAKERHSEYPIYKRVPK